jgi:hypothetical protein
MTTTTHDITEGEYFVTIRGQQEHVKVVLHSTPREVLKVHWIGTKRFPWSVDELVDAGATFERIS